MSSRPSSIARPLKRIRQDEAEDSSCNKRINLDQSKTTSTRSEPELNLERPQPSQNSATEALLLPTHESESTRDQTMLASLDTSYFIHAPLRLDRPSMRLVELLPPSTDGPVRCSIRHTTLDEMTADGAGPEYTCLSYVWGPETPTRSILINDKSFTVRENLWDFLHANSPPADQRLLDEEGEECELEVKPWFESIWIDALCIDQRSVLERNHQVQQMGQIYSRASRVLSWMGDDPKISKLFSMIQRYRKSRFEWISNDPMPHHEQFCKSMYWQRAWVTQELLLARVLFMQAKDIIVPLLRLEKVTMDLATTYGDLLDTTTRGLLRYLVSNPRRFRASHNLIENMELFRDKKCANTRDRIYSLKSVSIDGADLLVDYRCSFFKLAHNLLMTMKMDFCLRKLALVSEALQLDRNLSAKEKTLPLARIDRDAAMTLKRCPRCGRKLDPFNTINLELARTEHYFCLCCQHPSGSEIMQTHSNSHFGYLVVFWGIQSRKWHLYWGSSTYNKIWPEIKADIQVTRKNYEFQTLIVSVHAFMIITKYAAALDDPDDLGFSTVHHRTHNGFLPSPWKYTSAWRAKLDEW